ncbi:MAG: bifunctional diaminohydroxyphosphoribosylaminopyrimidine deaminase/5-amino-6-(5-phosphoribosylamino)uracil reductase RibD [Pseudomonadales bacterium]|nr:bifunctional diaminohydroxyphosphoribosylaminopyrimidine deaminase/5-amino-6-(5-phosphoribosylamino)uracil reductase RibD [Pseudomonadales bacterium]NNL11160.1 bifunctional diaminohydroxyphosphoribosylaminopyrimidine deaminase/5-amino-6-(5-phosphoribosylamino)uracil reductase RibD [Pseudomonadales bacterium]RZV58804.1 MAG: bifunctional diaminohydroxyphosphoribosylaminopyrimidine deaminase/5-amino-6-(5-phosphoribosylamino)uracil reductase RibD [Pseudomonadales bacterium]
MSTEQQHAHDVAVMTEALRLAGHGVYTSTPNPRVGCIIEKNGAVVGSGWHRRAGEAHAEVLALEAAGSSAAGATAYITLEPCNVHGRTGPCTEQLIKAGIARVVVAVEDPNPAVRGGGIAELLANGIQVDRGVCADVAEALNRGFFKRMRTGMPFVQAKMASSIDGRTAMSSGESQWITGAAARAEVQKMRAQSCVLVTGVDTIIIDDPKLTVRASELGEEVELEHVAPAGIVRQPALVIVDSKLRTPLDARVLADARETGRRVIIACASAVDPKMVAALEQQGAEVKVFEASAGNTDRNRVDLSALLAFLGQCEYNELMLESGATLFGAFMNAGLVDELALFMAPVLFGQTARPLAALDIAEIRDARGMSIVEARPVGADFLLKLVPAPATA